MYFIYLNVLFLMLIPSFILMYLIVSKQSKLTSHFSKNALEKLSISNQYFSNKARNITLFLSLIFMIIALARPITNEKINNVEAELNAVVIAIDVSKSMKAIDIYPNRLEFAKTKLLNIIDTSKTEAIGIILFAKSAFLLSAVTQDFSSLKLLINNLNTGINFDNGTNIFSTLETTQKLLKDYKSKNLILLTDGADNSDFKNEIEFANENNISVYTLALGTTQGSVIKQEDGNYLTDSKGNIVNVKLNENIKELSLKTNGGYINYSLNNDDINQILNDINLKSKKETFDDKKYKTYTELFYYPLAIGIFLLLIAFSSLPTFTKNKLSSIIFISLFLSINTNLNAFSIFDFKTIKEATQAYDTNDFDKASKEFEKLDSDEYRDYNLANSFYKANNFDKAIELYENIKSTNNNDLEFKRFHNLGNSYAKKNDFEKAIKNYEDALKLKNDKETKENLELVKKALEDNKKNDNKNQEQQKNDDSKENQDNKKDENNQQENNQEEKENNKNKNSNKQEKENQKQDKKEEQKQEMSNYEEEKWMKEIENQKTNSLLKKMESSNENSISNPW